MKQFKIIELPEMIGKTLQEAKDFVEKEYPNQLAKDEDRDDFIKSNPALLDWTWCFFFGSTLRNSRGHWNVPCVRWNGDEWYRNARWLDYDWNSDYRVVLLENSPKRYLTRMCWRSMKDRCDNTDNPRYKDYGGRGITYCERWKIYENFLEDMGEKEEGTLIDRIDNDGHYCKENCKWVTSKESAKNRRTSIIFNNETAKDASKRLGGGENLVSQRIKLGWSVEEAFTTPIDEVDSVADCPFASKMSFDDLILRVEKLEVWQKKLTDAWNNGK